MNALLTSIGGLGLFLFGMAVMVSGLRKLAGDQLHQWLARATRTPLSGTLSGAVVTAAIQSSSATMIATVGFVGAGLLSFPQALGVVFGANIGTTITGWIVALLGLKLKLTAAALPFMLVAAILYLMKGNRTLRGAGKAMAGFALMFMGIGFLQEGLSGARALIDLTAFDATGLSGRLVLLLIGIVLTLITQASSATVAAAVTALSTGAIDLPQAAAVIVGADVGTTAKAMLASIGGNAASRRTAFAHVAYNLFTGCVAFFLLPLYLWIWSSVAPNMVINSPEVIAVAYHSIFNIIGVSIALPFADQFAQLIERLYPDRDAPLVAALDDRLLDDANTATRTLESATRLIAATALRTSSSILSDDVSKRHVSPSEILQATAATRAFAVRTGKAAEEDDLNTRQLFAILHIIDHTERLIERLTIKGRYEGMASHPQLKQQAKDIATEMAGLADQITIGETENHIARLEQKAAELEHDNAAFRSQQITEAAKGAISPDALEKNLDSARWLRRLTYHSWRIGYYYRALFP